MVGCGGNGSAVAAGLPYLHQAMLVAGHPGGLRVTLMDGDIISPANCVRQPFSSAEIGLAKAVVMVSRLNLFWGLTWTSIPEFLSAQSKIGDFHFDGPPLLISPEEWKKMSRRGCRFLRGVAL